MSNEMDMLETIDQYLHGNMSEKEKSDFNNKLKEDEVLRKMFEKQSAIHLLVVEAGLDDIRNLMRNDLSKASTKKKNSSTKWLDGILLVILGVSVAGYLYNNRGMVNAKVEQVKQTTTESTIKTKEVVNAVQDVKTSEIKPKETSIVVDKSSTSNKEIIHSNNLVPNLQESTVGQKEVLNTVVAKVEGQAQRVEAQENLCANFDPKVSFETKPCVVDASNGEIRCLSGMKNLKYKLNDEVIGQNGVFTGLVSGKYKIVAENDLGCKWEKEGIIVKNTFCIENEKNTFNTVLDVDYQIPIAQSQRVDVLVYNRQMLNVASFNNVGELRWDGRTNGGVMAEPGLHKIEIKYKSGEHCFYSLTVFNQ